MTTPITYDIFDARDSWTHKVEWRVSVAGRFLRAFNDFHAALAWVRSQPIA
jgi:hypothetical protein